MEDFNIGKHCNVCNILDYLSYHCKTCDKSYCKTHYHNEYSCPFINENIDKHNQNNINNDDIKEFKNINFDFIICHFCNQKWYKHKGYGECDSCKNIFCLNHKIESSHNCKDGKIGKKESARNRKAEIMEKLKKNKI